MSINSALLAGVSGLVANSSALAAISDNIANVNTTSYKRNGVSFSDAVTSQAVAGRYSAGGVSGVVQHFISQQGLIQSSTSNTDLAISGDGMFVVTDKATGLTASDPRLFTRAGSFTPDAAGYLVNSSGLYLQGWPVQANGKFNTSPSDLTAMSSINVKNLGAAVSPTANIVLSANVDKASTVATAPPPIQLKVIDAAGGSHILALTLTPSATPNQWDASLDAVPASDVVNTVPGHIATGTVKFNLDGTIDPTSDVFGKGAGVTTLTIDASGGTAPNWSTAGGLPAQALNFDFTKLSQYNQASTVNSISQDGAGAGNIVAVQIDSTGIVSAVYDNSQVRKIAQVGLATFPNANGLIAVSGNAYQASLPSGQLVVKVAGQGGAGKIDASSLEASTVDLSSEFTGLITTQKAYSASSKIITTADTMLDELINIIR
jgi:flagellar hook protein FlgE